MKSIYFYISMLLLAVVPTACVDDSILETENNKKLPADTNYKEFANGYSIAVYVSLDQMGGNIATRADENDVWLQEAEDYLDPEEFRVLFFGEDNKFLFESKSRWLTEVEAKGGNRRWRVGIPVFQYLSDNYQTDESASAGELSEDGVYNWDAIVDYLKTHNFKVCILANSPEAMKNLPLLSDYVTNTKGLTRPKGWDAGEFGKIGPFWTPKNSALTTLDDLIENNAVNEKNELIDSEEKREACKETRVMTVFDLHHCQYDPFYDAKNHQGDRSIAVGKDGGAYEHIIKYETNTDITGTDTEEKVPYMGAYSSWLGEQKVFMDRAGTYIISPDEVDKYKNSNGNYYYPNGKSDETRLYEYSYYRLPLDKSGKESTRVNIPMFGIQNFEPLTDWTKGTTYNISEQTASQATDYSYRSIFLLRSVVKLELRIPMYDDEGNLIKVDLNYPSLFQNNYLARREPMDVISPTDSIWRTNHTTDCEWTRIKEYGPFCNTVKNQEQDFGAFRDRLSWYHGVWKDQGWKFNGMAHYPEGQPEPPHIYNPLVQRLQATFICNNFLPIGIPREAFLNTNRKDLYDEELGYDYEHTALNRETNEKKNIKIPTKRSEAEKYYPSGQGYYYRWVIYCGEKYINDANTLGYLSSNSNNNQKAYISFFRIKITHKGNEKVYCLPIVDYSKAAGTGSDLRTLLNTGDGKNEKSTSVPAAITSYVDKVAGFPGGSDQLPLPLVRNHLYRLTVSFGDGDDLNVQIIDSDQRTIGDIFFGKEWN